MPAASPPTPPCRTTWVHGQAAESGVFVLQLFLCHDAIALHHVTRHGFVAFVGGVGHHFPAVGFGQSRRVIDRVVVATGDAHDLGAENAAAQHAAKCMMFKRAENQLIRFRH